MIGTFLILGGTAYLGAKTYQHFSPNKPFVKRMGDFLQAQVRLPQQPKPHIKTADQLAKKSPFEIKKQHHPLSISTLSLGLSTAGLLSVGPIISLSLGILSVVPLLYSSRKMWGGPIGDWPKTIGSINRWLMRPLLLLQSYRVVFLLHRFMIG